MVIFLFGFWDDRKELSYKIKFAGQILAAIIVVIGGGLFIKELPFGDGFTPSTPFLYGLTIFFLVGITNAMNMTDGLDGLAGGATLLSFGLIAVLSIQSDAPNVLLITVAVVGGVLGFLRFNSHPAIVFMGDTGSQFLGFILGLESIMLTQYADPTLSKSLPLLILGLPLFDTLIVMLLRIKQGHSPFHADKNHIHHRLLGLGLSHFQAVVALYLMQSAFVLSAYFMAYSHDLLPFFAFIGYGVVIIVLLWLSENTKIKVLFSRPITWLSGFSYITRRRVPTNLFCSSLAPALMLGILTWVAILKPDVMQRLTPDIVALSALIFVASIYTFFARPGDAYYRIIFATFSALLVYLGIPLENNLPAGLYEVFDFCVFVGLALWLALNIYSGTSGDFKASPFDILIALLLLVMPVVSEVGGEVSLYSFALAKFIILLYTFELLISEKIPQSKHTYQYAVSLCVLAICVKYLFV
jgi:UDP-GlcNAc:undecaprenyl-phosphate GlcNAc-1-phosphate transferase